MPNEQNNQEAELPAIFCPECECEYEPDNSVEVDGIAYCSDCAHSCEECDFVTINENEIYSAYVNGYSRRSGTKCLCADCSFECADCNDRFANGIDEHTNASDERVCERCNENYYTCDSCATTIHYDDTYRVNDGTYCEDCGRRAERENEEEEEDDDSTLIHDYDYKPKVRFQKAIGEVLSHEFPTLFLGWEIEVDGAGESDANVKRAGIEADGIIYAKHDSSLDDGFEVVSHPGTIGYWRKFDWGFASKLQRMGYKSYDYKDSDDKYTCGMHVHVSRDALTETDICRLLWFFRDNAELVFKLSRRKRSALNQWAKIDGASYSSLAEKLQAFSGSRYEAVNLVPHRTVEFRIFRGTLDVASIKRNLALVSALCAFMKTDCQLTGDEFLRWINCSAESVVGTELAIALSKWIGGILPTLAAKEDNDD